jgi:glycosyltransferase involved in cell wall biosynthesis
MRIVFVVHTFFPKWRAGTEVYARSLARKALERGHEVFLTCYEPPEGAVFFDGIRVFDTIFEGIPVHRISFHKSHHLSHLKEYFNKDVEHHLLDYLADVRPDLVHVVHAMHLSTASIWAAKKLDIPVIANATDFWYICPTFQLVKWDESLCRGPHPLTCLACVTDGPTGVWIRRLGRHKWLAGPLSPLLVALAGTFFFSSSDWAANLLWLAQRPWWMKKTLPQVDVLFAPVENTAHLLAVNGIRPMELRTSGFGLEKLPAQTAQVETKSAILRVGYIGTFRHTKGLHVLLKAMRDLSPDRVHLDVYGEFGHFPEYDALVRDLAKDLRHVSFHPVFPNEHLQRVFASLDVLVMPALWYENSPLVVLSSLSFKTPVVASNVGSLADLITHGKNGLLFEMGNARDLASQLSKLVDDPSLLDRLRSGISEVKTIDENVAELLETYSSVLGNFPSTVRKEVRGPCNQRGRAVWLGTLIKSSMMLAFGAQFGASLALLRCEIKVTHQNDLSFDFYWHSSELHPAWTVFIHLIDENGTTQIQGDHRLWLYNQNPWGFIKYTLTVAVPAGAAGASYRVRLGVWNPKERVRLLVTRVRGLPLDREERAVSLGRIRLMSPSRQPAGTAVSLPKL